MSVLAILLAIASPGLASLTSANALSSAQSELAAAMMLARGEAHEARHHGRPGRAARRCAAPSSPAGWTIFVDTNGNGSLDAGETIIRQQPAFHSNVIVDAEQRRDAGRLQQPRLPDAVGLVTISRLLDRWRQELPRPRRAGRPGRRRRERGCP